MKEILRQIGILNNDDIHHGAVPQLGAMSTASSSRQRSVLTNVVTANAQVSALGKSSLLQIWTHALIFPVGCDPHDSSMQQGQPSERFSGIAFPSLGHAAPFPPFQYIPGIQHLSPFPMRSLDGNSCEQGLHGDMVNWVIPRDFLG